MVFKINVEIDGLIKEESEHCKILENRNDSKQWTVIELIGIEKIIC